MADEPAAFRTFSIEPPYQVRTIRKMLQTRRADLAGMIAEGYAKDWGDYNHRTGIIVGLDEALAFCDELEKAERK